MSPVTAALTPLDEAECYRLLRQVPFGRVVGTARALPLVVPVNFALDGHSVVFRTTEHGALARTDGSVVAFEADEIDPRTRTGWSVVLTGVARPVTAASELVRMGQLQLVTWVPGERDHWIRITPGIVTGRRLSSPFVPEQPYPEQGAIA